MYSFQIGAATKTPSAPAFIGRLLLFPAQTPTATEGVYPTVQASLNSCVVPVFAATILPSSKISELRGPKIGVLATLSERMEFILRAT